MLFETAEDQYFKRLVDIQKEILPLFMTEEETLTETHRHSLNYENPESEESEWSQWVWDRLADDVCLNIVVQYSLYWGLIHCTENHTEIQAYPSSARTKPASRRLHETVWHILTNRQRQDQRMTILEKCPLSGGFMQCKSSLAKMEH